MDMLIENRLLTFGGMIRYAIEQLQLEGPVTDLYSLYVDEYQDVNPAQTALIKAMLPPSCKLRVVGDDLQSIYNWRGSDVTRILEFPHDFGPAGGFPVVHELPIATRNWVKVANTVAEDIILRDVEKTMTAGREASRQKVVHWISTNDEDEQAETIVEIVRRFRRTGVAYSTIAILLRSVIGSGRPIYEALAAASIPVECPILSRGGSFIMAFLLPVLKMGVHGTDRAKKPIRGKRFKRNVQTRCGS